MVWRHFSDKLFAPSVPWRWQKVKDGEGSAGKKKWYCVENMVVKIKVIESRYTNIIKILHFVKSCFQFLN